MHLVKWPEEADQRCRLAEAGELCLLVLEPNVLPPEDLHRREDWVRVSADPIEVHSRIERLRSLNTAASGQPAIDEDGILSFGDRWVALGPGDVALARLLCDSFGTLVGRAALRDCVHPACTYAALAVKLHRMRRMLAPLGLNIATIRARGYVLQAEATVPERTHAVTR